MLYHLTNLTPRITKVCTKREKSTSNKAKKAINELSELRQEVLALIEIAKNDFKDSIQKRKSFTFNIKFNKSSALNDKVIPSAFGWNIDTSFVSTGSFNLNKNSSACSDRQHKTSTTPYFRGTFRRNFLSTHEQTRTFKTHRSIVAENQRNPSLFNRWRDAFNQQTASHDGDIEGRKLDAQNATQTTRTMQHESLSKLLNQFESNLTPEQKQQMKVSFAEGYLAASHQEKAAKEGRTIKYLRVLHLFLWICVGVAIIFSVFSTSNGSVFR